MATTVGSFSAIDDTEVDAESPITETLVTRLRDNSYWIDAGTRQTTQTSTTRVLTPDGAGGVQWVEIAGIAPGVDGTKGGGSLSTSSSSPSQIAEVSGAFLTVQFCNTISAGVAAVLVIDQSDDTYTLVSYDNSPNASYNIGTISGSYAPLPYGSGTGAFGLRKTGSNYEFYTTSSGTSVYSYLWT